MQKLIINDMQRFMSMINNSNQGRGGFVRPADGFFPSPAPFQDFCFFAGGKEREIGAAFKALNLVINTARGFSCASSAPLKSPFLSGWGRIGGRFRLGGMPQDFTLAEALEGAGNFTCCFMDGKRAQACADIFGMGALYIFEDGELSALSNRAHLAAIAALSAAKRELNIPWLKAAALSFGPTRDFPGFNDSPLLGLRRLAPGQWAVIDADGIVIKERKPPQSALSCEELLARAIEEAREDLAEFGALAGGKILFSADAGIGFRASAAPFINEGIAIKAPQPGADMEACAHMAALFTKLEIDAGLDEALGPVSREEALGAWRSYNFGFGHKLETPEAASRGASEGIEIIGAPPELFGALSAPAQPMPKGGEEERLAHLLENRDPLYPKLFDEEEKGLLADYVLKSAKGAGLEAFFQNGAARGWGLSQLFQRWAGRLAISPAINKSLYLAAAMASPSQREEAKPLNDFIRGAEPKLAELPHSRPYSWQKAAGLDAAEEGRKAWALDKLKEAAESARITRRRAAGAENLRLPLPVLDAKVLEAAGRLAALEPQLAPFLEKVIEAFRSARPLPLRLSLASKILSADDFFFPLDSVKDTAPRAIEAGFWETSIEGAVFGKREVEIRLAPGRERGAFYYALYLRSGSKLIKSFPYQNSPVFDTADFSGLFDNVTMFIKNKKSGAKKIAQRWL